MGKQRGNQSARQLSVSTRTRYRQSLPHDETAASLLTFYPILLGGRDRRARLQTLHRRNRRRQPSSRHPGDDSPGPSMARPRGRGAQHDRTTMTVVEGRHVRARVHPAWRGGPLWEIYQITRKRWGRSWSIGSSRRTAAGPHHRRRRRCRQMTAAATAAATSSCLGRRQPRHGREAFRARGGEQLINNRPEALRHEREG